MYSNHARTFYRVSLLLFLCFALSGFLAGRSQATILTFDISGGGFGNYSIIPQNYGDNVSTLSQTDGSYTYQYGQGNGYTPNIAVSYDLSNPPFWWDNGYGSLVNVAWAYNSSSPTTITLTPDPGYDVIINSFDLSGWGGGTIGAQILQIEYGSNILNYTPITIQGGQTTLTPYIHTSDPLTIRWQDAYWIALDNVNFDQALSSAPVPEPATMLLFCSGLVGLAGFSRKFRKN